MDLINAKNVSQLERAGIQDRTREDCSILAGLNDSNQYIQERSLLGMTRNATEPNIGQLNRSDMAAQNKLNSSHSAESSTQN